MFKLVSKSMKLSPKGGRLKYPLLPLGKDVFDHRMKLCVFPAPFLSFHYIIQICKRLPPLLEYLVTVTAVICFLSYFVTSYISFPSVTLRWFCCVWLNRTIVPSPTAVTLYLLCANSLSEVGSLCLQKSLSSLIYSC